MAELALLGDLKVTHGDLVEHEEQVRVQVVVVEGQAVHVVGEPLHGQRRQVVLDQGVERLLHGDGSVDEDQLVLLDQLRQRDELPFGGVDARELRVEGGLRVRARHRDGVRVPWALRRGLALREAAVVAGRGRALVGRPGLVHGPAVNEVASAGSACTAGAADVLKAVLARVDVRVGTRVANDVGVRAGSGRCRQKLHDRHMSAAGSTGAGRLHAVLGSECCVLSAEGCVLRAAWLLRFCHTANHTCAQLTVRCSSLNKNPSILPRRFSLCVFPWGECRPGSPYPHHVLWSARYPARST